ncbi:triose phosphate/3-phosphoglycerate/phosphate translocator [Rhodotorula toruloides]|uniref:Triose phosphate/3-phosphoglycerate/phosphate translocator n=1 Tax=Rhodotorula toruloides TaxID=5286 RepID=A0A511KHM8_RHOTO|nr:triose phosphate/3-phosphoglycerate/phosphate translocator [Rhodotorula toruloides]
MLHGAALAPVSEGRTRRTIVPVWMIVLGWIALSAVVILMNRDILVEKHFDHPVTLTTLHLIFQTCATRLLHRFTTLISGPPPAEEYVAVPLTDPSHPPLEDGTEEPAALGRLAQIERWKRKSVEMDWDTWRRQILPIALLFSLSLVLSNAAYLYCSVAFIHILKSFAPVAILLAAFAFRTKVFSLRLFGIVVLISAGVGIASYGEVDFSLIGFSIQMVAIVIEATRVTLIQMLLNPTSTSSTPSPNSRPPAPAIQSGMSPLKSLYFFAPAGLAINFFFLLVLEGMPAIRAIPALGAWTILSNASLTFALNLSAVMLIGVSAMVLSLSKIIKDILMVVGPVLLMGESLTLMQFVGYAIATVGMIVYKFTPN